MKLSAAETTKTLETKTQVHKTTASLTCSTGSKRQGWVTEGGPHDRSVCRGQGFDPSAGGLRHEEASVSGGFPPL